MKASNWILALALAATSTSAATHTHGTHGGHSSHGAHGSSWGDDWGIVAEGRFEKSLSVSGAVNLDVKTNWGSVDVRTGDGSTVRVVGIVKARKYSKSEAESRIAEITKNPPIKQTGNTITIGFDNDMWDHEERNRIGISYELIVPANTQLRSATGSGSMTIAGVAGSFEGSTGSGSITVSNLGADARVNTGSGSLNLNGVKGALRASTGSGSIRGGGIGGSISATTGSGSIELAQAGSGNVEVSTGSGSITIDGVKGALRARTGSGGIRVSGEPLGEWNVRTGSGTIRAKLPANASFDLHAETNSGRVYTDHPVTLQGSFGKRELRGKVRNGGPLLDLSTSSGSIHIE